jgi:hypothetical protein
MSRVDRSARLDMRVLSRPDVANFLSQADQRCLSAEDRCAHKVTVKSEVSPLKLYTYWRSQTSYRVRIALRLKGLVAEMVSLDLLRGDQFDASYRALNPEMVTSSMPAWRSRPLQSNTRSGRPVRERLRRSESKRGPQRYLTHAAPLGLLAGRRLDGPAGRFAATVSW